MRHQVHGKKLNRSRGHRKALFANLSQSLIEHERITTTLVKAKAVRPVVEKMVTRAKGQSLADRRAVIAQLPTTSAATKLFTVLAPRYAERPGGYTRIIKLGQRRGDGAEIAIIEFVQSVPTPIAAKAPKRRARAAESATASQAEEVVQDENPSTGVQPAEAVNSDAAPQETTTKSQAPDSVEEVVEDNTSSHESAAHADVVADETPTEPKTHA